MTSIRNRMEWTYQEIVLRPLQSSRTDRNHTICWNNSINWNICHSRRNQVIIHNLHWVGKRNCKEPNLDKKRQIIGFNIWDPITFNNYKEHFQWVMLQFHVITPLINACDRWHLSVGILPGLVGSCWALITISTRGCQYNTFFWI